MIIPKVEVNQTVRLVHRCLQFEILVKTRTNNPSQKSVVVECVVKPAMDCQSRPYKQIRHGMTENTRTTDSGYTLVQRCRCTSPNEVTDTD